MAVCRGPRYALGWGMNPEIEEVGLILVKLGTPEEVRLVSTGRVTTSACSVSGVTPVSSSVELVALRPLIVSKVVR